MHSLHTNMHNNVYVRIYIWYIASYIVSFVVNANSVNIFKSLKDNYFLHRF